MAVAAHGPGQAIRQLLANPPHPARFYDDLTATGITNYHGALKRFLDSFPPGSALLDLGSGSRRLRAGIVNCDITRRPQVDLVADGRRLPFGAATFEGIVLQSVIEHVREAEQVVAETARVLRPGGRAYVEVPFVYPIHDSSDYHRWSLDGLESMLAPQLEVLERGVTQGPASALSLVWRAWLDNGLGRVHWALPNTIAWATTWMFRVGSRKRPAGTPRLYASAYVVGRLAR